MRCSDREGIRNLQRIWRPATTKPVSYTHLDVYKRQEYLILDEIRITRGFRPKSAGNSCYVPTPHHWYYTSWSPNYQCISYPKFETKIQTHNRESHSLCTKLYYRELLKHAVDFSGNMHKRVIAHIPYCSPSQLQFKYKL